MASGMDGQKTEKLATLTRDYKSLKQRFDRTLDLCLSTKIIQAVTAEDISLQDLKDRDSRLLKGLNEADKLFEKLKSKYMNQNRDLDLLKK